DAMTLVSVKNLGNAGAADDVSYLALEISGLNASLVGLDDVLQFSAWNIGVLVNSAKNSAGATDKLDWSSFAPDPGSLALPDLSAINASVDVSLSGAAELNVLSGLVVLKVASFEMQLGTVSGSDDNGTTLAAARAMTVTLSGVELWVGPGGRLARTEGNGLAGVSSFDNDAVLPGALGFGGHVDSMTLVSLKNLGNAGTADDVSYLALELSGLSAKLVG